MRYGEIEWSRKTYGWVAERALCDSLEEGGLADVGEADDTTLEVVAGATQKDLLLLLGLLGSHLGLGTVCVVAAGAGK